MKHDPRHITAAVRALLDDPGIELDHFDVEPIWLPRIDSTRGVYRVTAWIAGPPPNEPVSVICKVVDRGERGRREVDLYTSGVLAHLPGRLTAPRRLGTYALDDDSQCLYLDDLHDCFDGRWPDEAFAALAEALGRLAGSRDPAILAAAGNVPERNLLTRDDIFAHTLRALDDTADNDLRSLLPRDTQHQIGLLLDRKPAIVALLARNRSLPCHGDAQRRNALARGTNEFALIDWPNFALAPAGLDIATLVYYAVAHFDIEPSRLHNLMNHALDRYLHGLRESGWRGDARIVELGFRAQLSIALAVMELGPTVRLVTDEAYRTQTERFLGQNVDEILARRCQFAADLIEMGSRAVNLTHSLAASG